MSIQELKELFQLAKVHTFKCQVSTDYTGFGLITGNGSNPFRPYPNLTLNNNRLLHRRQQMEIQCHVYIHAYMIHKPCLQNRTTQLMPRTIG